MKKIRGEPDSVEAPAGQAFGWAMAAVVFASALTTLRDTDTWWHLMTGRVVWTSGIPSSDPFSWVIAGRPWTAIEWLAQAIFYGIYHVGKAPALILFTAAILAAAFFLLWSSGRARPGWSALFCLLASWGCQASMVTRPFIFDFIIVAALCAKFWRLDFSAPPKYLGWLLPLVAAVWANLHGAAALLMPVLIATAAAAERLVKPKVRSLFWARTAVLSFVAVLFNPAGPAVFTQFRDLLAYEAILLIREWRPPVEAWGGVFGLMFVLSLPAAWRVGRKKPFAVAWLLITGVAAVRMERNVPLFLLCAAPVLTAAVPESWAWPRRLGAAAFALAAMLGTWGHMAYAHSYLLSRFRLEVEFPLKGAMDFVSKSGLSGRVFNEYESGGEMLMHGWPERKVFIDSRGLEYGGKLTLAALAWFRPGVWKSLDQEFDFDYAVLRRHISGAYRTQTLDSLPEWIPVYFDDEAMVYVKNRPSAQTLIQRYGYRLIQPGRSNTQYTEPIIQEGRGAELLAELERALAQAPRCVNAQLLKTYVLMRSGRIEEAVASARLTVGQVPDRALPRLSLGWALNVAGRLEEAQAVYEEGLSVVRRAEKVSLGADLQNNLGRVLERRGRMDEARARFRKALKWNPAQGDARHNLYRLAS